jgi:hypothetical protein
MAFLAAFLAYLGTAVGIAMALLMSLSAFLAVPAQPDIPHQTLAMAAKPGEPKTAPATPSTTAVPSKIGPYAAPAVAENKPAPQFKSAAYARKAQMPDFEARYMGYVNEPSADSSRFQ